MSQSRRPWPVELETQALAHPLAQHGGAQPHAESLTLSSVWSMPSLEAADAALSQPGSDYVYRRDAHPNAASLAHKLAQVHGAAACALTAQGMSALAAVAWTVNKPGSEVWLARDLYGKTRALFQKGLGPWQVFSRTFDPTVDEDLQRLAGGRPSLVIVETISNPRLQVCDISRIAQVVHERGGLLLVDNTFASHLICRPLALGADLCMESLTKIVSGHSDAMVGMVCGQDASLMERIASAVSLYGLASSPLDCFLTSRGLASLALRLEAACRNAQALAEALSLEGLAVKQVDYPGLPGHPQASTASRQLTAPGWMVCIELEDKAGVSRMLHRLSPEIPFCPSLGGIQTTVSHPASTSHRALAAEELAELGISAGTVRISCGVEPTQWLCERFLSAVQSEPPEAA